MTDAAQKVVLAYSGGLDTSAILRWLQRDRGCEVVVFTADIGQGGEIEAARAKAEALGVQEIFIEDMREEFARDFVFPMFRANAVYEGCYLLGTAIARPLIARRLVEIAAETGADAIAHGATGKGNDQIRFELAAYALNSQLKVIAPWREWDLNSREKLLEYCARHGVPVEEKQEGRSPYSMDANLLHISYEGGPLEDPMCAPEEDMWRWTVSPQRAPDKAQHIEVGLRGGDLVSVDGEELSPAQGFAKLNALGAAHGVGRLDLVENRYVGIKSRGCYETPGGTILLAARRAVESLSLDAESAHLKDQLMPRYSELIYNGYWFSPERRMLQRAIDESQQCVDGVARLELFKGAVRVIGRRSSASLYDPYLATFEDDDQAYDQYAASGFITLRALRLKALAKRQSV